MVDLLDKPISDSVQMYLVKLKRLEEKINPVPLSYLADSLSISSVSVNEMCRKMQDQDLIDYQPYKGASLTPEGDREALKILRRHRLWEVFLVEKLHFSYEESHELADILEHATTKELADRLDDFLDNPVVNPEGKEIPSVDGKSKTTESMPLSDLEIGESGVCVLESGENAAQDFLKKSGVKNGTTLKILGRTEDLVLIAVGQSNMNISNELAEQIKIIRIKDDGGHADNDKTGNQDKSNERLSMSKEKIASVTKIPLEKLAIGQKGTIVSLSGKGQVKQRMMDMGLVPGSKVEIIRVAPLGDPIEINLKGYNLSLRRNEAKSVMVEVAGEVE